MPVEVKGRTDEIINSAAAITEASDLGDLSERTLDVLQSLMAPKRFGVYLFDPSTMRPMHIATRGVSDYFLAVYEEYGRARDPVLQYVLDHQTPIDSESLMSRRDWMSLPYYEEVLRMHRVDVALQAPILCGEHIVGTLNLGDVRGYTPETVALVGALGRLVGSIIQSIETRETAIRERDQIRAALELSDQAVIMSDLRSATRFSSMMARNLLDTIEGADDPSFLEDILCTPVGPRGDLVRIRVPLKAGGEADLQLRSVRDDSRSLMLTYFRVSSGTTLSLPNHLSSRLSPREREVANLAIEGLHDTEIAARLYLSKHTVKEYLRNAYQKLAVCSRFELVALVAQEQNDQAGAQP